MNRPISLVLPSPFSEQPLKIHYQYLQYCHSKIKWQHFKERGKNPKRPESTDARPNSQTQVLSILHCCWLVWSVFPWPDIKISFSYKTSCIFLNVCCGQFFWGDTQMAMVQKYDHWPTENNMPILLISICRLVLLLIHLLA